MNRFMVKTGAMLLVLTLIFSLGPHTVSALSLAQTAYEKDSFSHYVDREGLAVREELLWGFEEALHYHSLDTTDSTQGKGCGVVTLEQDAPSTTLVFHLTNNRFLADASDLYKVTFKLDVWINDMSLLGHDHESVQPENDFTHQGTLYFGLQDENGRNHKINTSISDNNGYAGWQTLEFSLLHDNSKHDDINYSRITNAFLHVIGRKGLTIKFDNLRACYYSNEGYVPNTDGFPDGCRIISRCDAEALDGLVISEWYGAKMDFENKRYGTSCLAFNCTPKDDYRIFFGVRNITLTYNTDYICFWVKVPENAQFATWFLEANHVQGAGEYQNSDYSVTRITQHAVGGFRYGEWNLIQLPLTSLFKRNGAGDTLDLRHFRMVPTSAGEDFTLLLDQVYVCNADQAAVAAKELLDERQAIADEAAAQVVMEQIDALNVQSLDDKPAVVAARAAYDGLTDTQKGLVTNFAKLQQAEAKIAELEEAADKAAAQAVEDQINALDVRSLDDASAVSAARRAYDNLTDTQKDLVTNLQKLVDAETEIERLKAQADQEAIDRAAAKVVQDQIDELNVQSLDDKPAVVAARAAYDTLTDTQKDLVTNFVKLQQAEAKIVELEETADKAAAKAVDELIAELPEPDDVVYDDEDAVMAARHAYDGLTDNQKQYVINLEKLEKIENNLSVLPWVPVKAQQVIDQINQLPTEISVAHKTTIEAVREAYDSLAEDHKPYVDNLSVLEAAENALAVALKGEADKAAAKVVQDQIDVLNVQSLDDKADVVAARDAYNGLTDTQKDLVTNLAKLVDAEEKIAELEKPIDPPVEITYGDVDGNGKVEATDALEVLKSVVGKVTLTDEQFKAADTDVSGKADATDALNILKKVVGKIDKFPVEA